MKNVLSKFLTMFLCICLVLFFCYHYFYAPYILKNKVLQEIITKLEADSRIAEIIVTDSHYDEITAKTSTTIKFMEYSPQGKALKPQYFSFHDNLIQFQSLVLRFDDDLVRAGGSLRGKSAYLFWKAFVLDGSKTEEYNITKINSVPDGYKIVDRNCADLEKKFWDEFWIYAFDQDMKEKAKIKNVQIEAPGVIFSPGFLYTLKIEHDGGIRIDIQSLPEILNGEIGRNFKD